MYAVIQTGGKQYRVAQGDLISIEKLSGEVGETIDFKDVLFVGGEDGSETSEPVVSDVRVVGTIVAQGKGQKTLVFKFKKRKMYRKLTGHRQNLTGVRIDDILVSGTETEAAAVEKPVEKPKKPRKSGAKAKPEADPVEDQEKE